MKPGSVVTILGGMQLCSSFLEMHARPSASYRSRNSRLPKPEVKQNSCDGVIVHQCQLLRVALFNSEVDCDISQAVGSEVV